MSFHLRLELILPVPKYPCNPENLPLWSLVLESIQDMKTYAINPRKYNYKRTLQIYSFPEFISTKILVFGLAIF